LSLAPPRVSLLTVNPNSYSIPFAIDSALPPSAPSVVFPFPRIVFKGLNTPLESPLFVLPKGGDPPSLSLVVFNIFHFPLSWFGFLPRVAAVCYQRTS